MTLTQPTFILDISRLLSRAGCLAPTGIDRVELAYAQYMINDYTQQSYFAAYSPLKRIYLLPENVARQFIVALTAAWNLGSKNHMTVAIRLAQYLKISFFFVKKIENIDRPVCYLLLSHHHLMNKKAIEHFLHQTKAHFVPMIHDLIPLEYPEYARPRELSRHLARIKTVTALAKAVIVPTKSVASSLKRKFLESKKHDIPIWIIPHGIHIRDIPKGKSNFPLEKPYFIYLSTIEPRKNHLMILHLWRAMCEKYGERSTPYLILIGKRGWENENILDLLDRAPSLQHLVKEKNNLSDQEVITLLRGTNGLLFPSFTEGYGLPLAEAMYLQVPSICADIPALREVGGDIPYYIDPLDTPTWEKAIKDFSERGPLWKVQTKRLKYHKPLTWDKSISQAVKECTLLLKNNNF